MLGLVPPPHYEVLNPDTLEVEGKRCRSFVPLYFGPALRLIWGCWGSRAYGWPWQLRERFVCAARGHLVCAPL